MRIRRLLSAAALLLTAALLCACAGGNPGGATPAPGGNTPAPELVSPTPTPEPTPEPTPTPSPAEQLLAGMTAEEKVWQLFILHPSQLTETGTLLTDAKGVAEILPAGGIILDSTNLESEAQTLALIADLQALSEIPLLVSVDEEGGAVARVGPALGMTTLSSMFHYRAEGTDRARENARALAEGLASLGFNVDFAPVADVWTNPANTVIGARAYSDDPQQAAELVAAAVEGFHLGGVSATLKHFPGHGDTQEDSHNGAAYAYKTLPELMECEMLPFIAGIEAGAELVMVAHITLPALDAERPATLSEAVVTDLLRGELGFSGLIVTDALSMGAITQAYGDEAALLALEAGCDLLLMPQDASAAAALILERADPARIDESVLRILEWKLARGLIEAE